MTFVDGPTSSPTLVAAPTGYEKHAPPRLQQEQQQQVQPLPEPEQPRRYVREQRRQSPPPTELEESVAVSGAARPGPKDVDDPATLDACASTSTAPWVVRSKMKPVPESVIRSSKSPRTLKALAAAAATAAAPPSPVLVLGNYNYNSSSTKTSPATSVSGPSSSSPSSDDPGAGSKTTGTATATATSTAIAATGTTGTEDRANPEPDPDTRIQPHSHSHSHSRAHPHPSTAHRAEQARRHHQGQGETAVRSPRKATSAVVTAANSATSPSQALSSSPTAVSTPVRATSLSTPNTNSRRTCSPHSSGRAGSGRRSKKKSSATLTNSTSAAPLLPILVEDDRMKAKKKEGSDAKQQHQHQQQNYSHKRTTDSDAVLHKMTAPGCHGNVRATFRNSPKSKKYSSASGTGENAPTVPACVAVPQSRSLTLSKPGEHNTPTTPTNKTAAKSLTMLDDIQCQKQRSLRRDMLISPTKRDRAYMRNVSAITIENNDDNKLNESERDQIVSGEPTATAAAALDAPTSAQENSPSPSRERSHSHSRSNSTRGSTLNNDTRRRTSKERSQHRRKNNTTRRSPRRQQRRRLHTVSELEASGLEGADANAGANPDDLHNTPRRAQSLPSRKARRPASKSGRHGTDKVTNDPSATSPKGVAEVHRPDANQPPVLIERFAIIETTAPLNDTVSQEDRDNKNVMRSIRTMSTLDMEDPVEALQIAADAKLAAIMQVALMDEPVAPSTPPREQQQQQPASDTRIGSDGDQAKPQDARIDADNNVDENDNPRSERGRSKSSDEGRKRRSLSWSPRKSARNLLSSISRTFFPSVERRRSGSTNRRRSNDKGSPKRGDENTNRKTQRQQGQPQIRPSPVNPTGRARVPIRAVEIDDDVLSRVSRLGLDDPVLGPIHRKDFREDQSIASDRTDVPPGLANQKVQISVPTKSDDQTRHSVTSLYTSYSASNHGGATRGRSHKDQPGRTPSYHNRTGHHRESERSLRSHNSFVPPDGSFRTKKQRPDTAPTPERATVSTAASKVPVLPTMDKILAAASSKDAGDAGTVGVASVAPIDKLEVLYGLSQMDALFGKTSEHSKIAEDERQKKLSKRRSRSNEHRRERRNDDDPEVKKSGRRSRSHAERRRQRRHDRRGGSDEAKPKKKESRSRKDSQTSASPLSTKPKGKLEQTKPPSDRRRENGPGIDRTSPPPLHRKTSLKDIASGNTGDDSPPPSRSIGRWLFRSSQSKPAAVPPTPEMDMSKLLWTAPSNDTTSSTEQSSSGDESKPEMQEAVTKAALLDNVGPIEL